MKSLIENFAKPIKVKTIVTFVILIIYSILSLRGDIPGDNVHNIALVVIAFYFGTQTEKKE